MYLPGVPLAIFWSSNFTTGTMSFVVTPMKSSSTFLAWSGVMDFSTIVISISRAAWSMYHLVIEGRMLDDSGAVKIVLSAIAKKAEPAPSVIRPALLTKIASAHFFFSASCRARTLGRRLRDFMSHLFHRRSG